MKKIITVKLWNRAEYIKRVVIALEQLNKIKEYKVIFSVDKSNEKELSKIKNILEKSELDKDIYYHEKNLGCAGNTRFCLDKGFENEFTDYVIHLEDDTIPAKDYLEFMEWGYEQSKNDPSIFAVCPFVRKDYNKVPLNEMDINKCFKKSWFETGGGFGITRFAWNKIKEMGNIYGVIMPGNTKLRGEQWKKTCTINDKGTYGWPMNMYFKEERLCIYPEVSRVQNIGEIGGKFNPSAQWHRDHVLDKKWIMNESFNNKNNINYYIGETKHKINGL